MNHYPPRTIFILKNVISFEQTDYPAAQQWISLLYPHLKERNPLSLKYKPFGIEVPLDLKVVPLMLKEFNARWYLIAHDLETSKVRNYALDRIQSIEEYYFDLYQTKITFNPTTHFSDLVGVTVTDEGPKTIRFQTSPYLANYIDTKKIHHTQRKLDKAENLYELKAHINPELIARFLSLGEDLWISAPKELVERVRGKVAAMKEKYG
ncbi:MAG: WYL domain-containing protein [Imperialibacter sp.]|uniref:helix-turn-helix transcriptional regulator n=1 Tax=Imperialibacter sp. TaxID=2038411 RepID=UPI0032EF4AD2